MLSGDRLVGFERTSFAGRIWGLNAVGCGEHRQECLCHWWLAGSREETEFFAALDGLGAAGGAELVECAGAVGLDGVFGDEELGGDFAIAEAAGDEGEDFEFAWCDAEGLLLGGVGREALERAIFRGSEVGCIAYRERLAERFAVARDAEAEPDAECREEAGDECAVEFDGVLDHDEAVLCVLKGGDEEAADEAED